MSRLKPRPTKLLMAVRLRDRDADRERKSKEPAGRRCYERQFSGARRGCADSCWGGRRISGRSMLRPYDADLDAGGGQEYEFERAKAAGLKAAATTANRAIRRMKTHAQKRQV